MDEEHTSGYTVPCAVCSDVNWGVSDEGRFYCRSCHNVIERTREVVDSTFTPGSTRVSTIGRGRRSKRPERGRQWLVCEGFQFILRNQADALLSLGVSPHFKDDVLLQLWRKYLQCSRQAYTRTPVRSSRFKVRGVDSDSDSGPDSSFMSASETDGDPRPSSAAQSTAGSSTDWSVVSGSLDAASYLSPGLKRRSSLMTMKKTLALIHLGLTWSREGLTLSDLLRCVSEGVVPYVNAFQDLPEEMKLHGRDALIFRVESIPSHQAVHQEAQHLALFLQLPAFPPIRRQCLLHPELLSLRYLTEANLPDELHPLVVSLLDQCSMLDQTLHPPSPPVLPRFDLQAAAAIVLTMKLLFGLDDHTEWSLSNEAADQDDTGNIFHLRRWFRLLQAALTRGQLQRDHIKARRQWKAKTPLEPSRKKKCVVMKKKGISEQLQVSFEHVSSCRAGVQQESPSSFRFLWGDQDGADGPSLHHLRLNLGQTSRDLKTPTLWSYCQASLRSIRRERSRSLLQLLDSRLPKMLVWLLGLFSFMLDVKPENLLEETLKVERRLLRRKTTRTRSRTRTRTRARAQAEIRTR